MRLQVFADALLEVSKSITIKASARGWAYLLEGEKLNGKTITKADFDQIEGNVNDCRKAGYIPVDFVAEEEARGFDGVETPDTDTPTEYMKGYLDAVLTCENWYTPDWWEGEEYYIQMLVEKVDLKTLFSPVCMEYHIPIATAKGWASIMQRAIYAKRFKQAEEVGLRTVLLYCGDHDPDGLRISDFIRSNLEDLTEIHWIDGTEGYDPTNLEITRFGLDYEFITKNNLTWIDNLITGSKKNLASPSHPNNKLPYVQDYIRQFGVRKCEANAIMKKPEEAEELCRGAIEAYLGEGALRRFKAKRDKVHQELERIREKAGLKEAVAEALEAIEAEE
jgi:hypothetical protein